MKKNINCWLVFFFFISTGSLFSRTKPDFILTVDDFCSAFPDRAEYIFMNLNPDYPGLEKSFTSYRKGEISFACQYLLEYFAEKGKTERRVGLFPQVPGGGGSADSALTDVFTFQGVSDRVPRLPEGGLKWDYTGPDNDMEWAWALNRHYPLSLLLNAFGDSGDQRYIRYADEFIRDWIVSSLPYPGVKSSTAMWRGLEVSFRVKAWSRFFYMDAGAGLISSATRLLILSSLPDHAHYARHFHARNNWLTMEMSGLATVAAYWPEFRESAAWLQYARDAMLESMKEQVYPDGVQTELTSSYHLVALTNFMLFRDIYRKTGFELPVFYEKTLESMWNYLAYTIRPDGRGILNNDADLENNRRAVLDASSGYGREDWRYIVNNGESGTEPPKGPSVFFPWAGQLISRSGDDGNAQWSFFDTGPWGSGHQHNDKLHVSVFAYGRDLLVDAGRFSYRGAIADKFRKYATGSQSHNVLLVDGKGQEPGPRVAEKEIPAGNFKTETDFDYAVGTMDRFTNLEGTCCQTRILFYVREKYWIVVDRITTDRPRDITTLWHWHPDNHVLITPQGAICTHNERGNLKVIPVGETQWKTELVRGLEHPEIQGWYSPEYNTYMPAVAAVCSTRIEHDAAFVWLLVPSEKRAPQVKAKIDSSDEQGIILEVSGPGNYKRKVVIPFTDSRDALLICPGEKKKKPE
jgi:hypothetical protein